jgi:prepilin-type processing-associated H-X9-DG protein
MQRKKMAIRFLVALVLFGGIAMILWPVFDRARAPRHWSCQSNLKQIALGYAQYVQDYDECLPLISTGSQGWANSLQPYIKSHQIFQCPSVNNATDKVSSDYFLNARVAGAYLNKIPFVGQTILLGEGVDNGALNAHFSELPLDWKTDEKSPARRHLDGANYAFVDGHVKWFEPNKISVQSPSKARNSTPTFAVR